MHCCKPKAKTKKKTKRKRGKMNEKKICIHKNTMLYTYIWLSTTLFCHTCVYVLCISVTRCLHWWCSICVLLFVVDFWQHCHLESDTECVHFEIGMVMVTYLGKSRDNGDTSCWMGDRENERARGLWTARHSQMCALYIYIFIFSLRYCLLLLLPLVRRDGSAHSAKQMTKIEYDISVGAFRK